VGSLYCQDDLLWGPGVPICTGTHLFKSSHHPIHIRLVEIDEEKNVDEAHLESHEDS